MATPDGCGVATAGVVVSRRIQTFTRPMISRTRASIAHSQEISPNKNLCRPPQRDFRLREPRFADGLSERIIPPLRYAQLPDPLGNSTEKPDIYRETC